jgi:hypothetical protein
VLNACKKDETMVKASADAKPSKLAATYDNLVLNENDAAADAIEFKWDKSDFGFDAAITYSVEVGKKDSNFVNSRSIGVGADLSTVLTVGAFNALLNQMNAVGFQPNAVEVRLKAEIGKSVAPVYSNVIPLVVTPYLDKPPYQTLYLVGDGTFGQWDNTKASPIFRDPANPFLFTYTGKFSNGNIKFLGVLGMWAPSWGLNGTGGVMFRAKESDPDPANIAVTEGYYTVKLDLRNLTFTKTLFDASAAKTFASIGIIGPFTDWGSVIPMTKTALNPHIWTIDHTFAGDTEFKFRIPEGWDNNWGANTKAVQAEPYGKGRPGGENYLIKAGTYTLVFNDITSEYVFIKK